MVKDIKYGEQDWDAIPSPDSNSSNQSRKGLFLKMEYGKEYTMRILSKPFQYYAHWTTSNANAALKVNCAVDNCPVCEAEQTPPKPRWLLLALYNGEVKILDVAVQIFQQLKDLAQHPKWGALGKYDITLKKGKKGDNPLYNVNPTPPAPLTDEQEKIRKTGLDPENEDYINLALLCEPWTIEKINARIAGEQFGEGQTEKNQETHTNSNTSNEDDLPLEPDKVEEAKVGVGVNANDESEDPDDFFDI